MLADHVDGLDVVILVELVFIIIGLQHGPSYLNLELFLRNFKEVTEFLPQLIDVVVVVNLNHFVNVIRPEEHGDLLEVLVAVKGPLLHLVCFIYPLLRTLSFEFVYEGHEQVEDPACYMFIVALVLALPKALLYKLFSNGASLFIQ